MPISRAKDNFSAHQTAVLFSIAEVNCVLQFLIDVFTHLVAAGTESLGVGEFHGGVKSTPEYEAHSKPPKRQKSQAKMFARTACRRPITLDPINHYYSPITVALHATVGRYP